MVRWPAEQVWLPTDKKITRCRPEGARSTFVSCDFYLSHSSWPLSYADLSLSCQPNENHKMQLRGRKECSICFLPSCDRNAIWLRNMCDLFYSRLCHSFKRGINAKISIYPFEIVNLLTWALLLMLTRFVKQLTDFILQKCFMFDVYIVFMAWLHC